MGMDPTIVIAALLALAIGGGLGFWLGTARQSRKVMQAAAIKAEYDEYREQVTRHFGQAAEHFQTIGREYRALYEHMASGADTLCAAREIGNKLSFVPGDAEPESGPDESSRAEPARDDAAPPSADEPADEDDDVTEAAAEAPSDGHEKRDAAAPPPGDASPSAAKDGPRADAEGDAPDKPERIYH